MTTETFNTFDLIIFGGDGDLAFKKIYPALYYRFKEGQIPSGSQIISVSNNSYGKSEFKALLRSSLILTIPNTTDNNIDLVLNSVQHITLDATKPEDYFRLTEKVNNSKNAFQLYYLATPSTLFGSICENLATSNCTNENSRVVLEKPLGNNLKSSEEINEKVNQYFTEKQIYRIDHYLGKETVQNLMVLRFANNIFEGLWNSKSIDNVQITVAESIGVGNRGNYYDNYGALRDMVQNHLLQLLCLVAMETPSVLNANEVRDEKLKVLKALRPFTSETINTHSTRGQYTNGTNNKNTVPSYLDEIGKSESNTETFVALKTYIDNWRWANVPFYLRTGKRLPQRYSEIIINFKEVPHNIFPEKHKLVNNKLIIRLQPDEKIELVQMVKIPGPGGYRYKPVSLTLDFNENFTQRMPDAYERLLMDVVRGNQTLFMRRDEVEAAWIWTESILDEWTKNDIKPVSYEAGTWGPGNDIFDNEEKWHFNDIEKTAKEYV